MFHCDIAVAAIDFYASAFVEAESHQITAPTSGQADCSNKSIMIDGASMTTPEYTLDALVSQPLASKWMRIAGPILVIVLAVAFATYGLDCFAMTTPAQAMQCCRSMPCSSHGHSGQDCCKRMSAGHSPYLQPSPQRGTSSGHVVIVLSAESPEPPGLESPTFKVAARCHPPPLSCVPASAPLRI